MSLALSSRLKASLLLLALSGAATTALLVPIQRAWAQSDDDAEAEAEAADAQKKAEARREAKAAAPPAALPGAEANEDDGEHASTDVNPTTALFDAINRGSLNAAKEALNRGADMGARNVLGQKPIDMAIDLNRNDIIFLLLSMRTYNDNPTRLASNVDDGESDDVAPTKGSAGHVKIGGRAVRQVAVKSPYDVHGGTPKPDVGFLGFGG